jgi:uncharacterized alpha-E superfamily protein
MTCRILDVKRKTLALAPEEEGRPLDVHQWQALLRSLSGYEPYRRVYDARILPERVLEFVLKHPAFPRSLLHALREFAGALDGVAAPIRVQTELTQRVTELAAELRALDTRRMLVEGGLETYVRLMLRRCRVLARSLEEAYFGSLRAAPAPVPIVPEHGLVPQ